MVLWSSRNNIFSHILQGVYLQLPADLRVFFLKKMGPMTLEENCRAICRVFGDHQISEAWGASYPAIPCRVKMQRKSIPSHPPSIIFHHFNIQKTMENHHFQWENPRNSYCHVQWRTVKLPEGNYAWTATHLKTLQPNSQIVCHDRILRWKIRKRFKATRWWKSDMFRGHFRWPYSDYSD